MSKHWRSRRQRTKVSMATSPRKNSICWKTKTSIGSFFHDPSERQILRPLCSPPVLVNYCTLLLCVNLSLLLSITLYSVSFLPPLLVLAFCSVFFSSSAYIAAFFLRSSSSSLFHTPLVWYLPLCLSVCHSCCPPELTLSVLFPDSFLRRGYFRYYNGLIYLKNVLTRQLLLLD